MYEILFDKRALDLLNKLEHGIKKRIWDKLQECKDEPFRYLKHLTQIKVLYVEKIGHRKNIYER